MLTNLYHGACDNNGLGTGTATIGSSEAIMLGGLAMKKAWQAKRKAAGKPYDKPNLVRPHSHGYQVLLVGTARASFCMGSWNQATAECWVNVAPAICTHLQTASYACCELHIGTIGSGFLQASAINLLCQHTVLPASAHMSPSSCMCAAAAPAQSCQIQL